jgi:hypothetical protein
MRRVLVLLFSLLVAAPPVMAEDVQYIFALPSRMKGELDVVAALSKGIYFEPPMVGDDEAILRFQKAMGKGVSYPVYIAGVPKGKATLELLDKERLLAKAKIDFKQTENAIATNIKPVKKHAAPMPLTAQQKKAITASAVAKLKAEGVKIADPSKVHSQFLGRDLNGDGKMEAIAYHFVPASKLNNSANAVLTFANWDVTGKLHIMREHVEHVRKKHLMEGATLADVGPGFLTNTFFDNFDINGDGRDEIITTFDSFEGVWYAIFHQKPSGSWTTAYKIYRYRQAF